MLCVELMGIDLFTLNFETAGTAVLDWSEQGSVGFLVVDPAVLSALKSIVMELVVMESSKSPCLVALGLREDID